MKTIAVIGTLDTKGKEFGFIKSLIEARGLGTFCINTGVFEPAFEADVSNAEIAAAALAKCLKVRKFALVSDVPGLLKDPEDPRTLLSTLHLKSVQTLKQEGVIAGGMLPKIESCEDAIRAGVKKVHLVDGRMAHSLLLEIFTREGVGTEITE